MSEIEIKEIAENFNVGQSISANEAGESIISPQEDR